MDSLITTYIDTIGTDQLKFEIYRAFHLIEVFNLKYQDMEFTDIISNDELDDNEKKTEFLLAIETKLKTLIKKNLLAVSDDIALSEMNEILSALECIMVLPDYSELTSILDCLDDNVKLAAEILSDYCELDYINLMTLLTDVPNAFFEGLKAFIKTKSEDYVKDLEKDDSFIPRLSSFLNIYGYDNLGGRFVNETVALRSELSTYLSLIDVDAEIVLPSNESTAINILSLLLISSDGSKDPLQTFRLYSSQILPSTDLVLKIEPILISAIGKIYNPQSI